MSTFCIPKNLVEKLKESALKGEVDIKKLYEMSSSERRDFFASHTNKELGRLINTEFEKAMISKQKTALTDWAKSVFTPEAKAKPVYKNVIDKINTLEDMGVLDAKTERAFLEDVVSDKLGINISQAEVKIISEKAKRIDEAQRGVGNDLGSPDKMQETVDFFKAKKEMDDYLQGLSPASKTKVLTGTIGRGMMLASVKSPILNIGSNIELAFTEGLVRRVAGGMLKGTNDKLANDYVKMVNKVYQETGYDISRMTSLNDGGASGGRVLGDIVHSQGPGAVRAIGRVVEDIVFKQLMGAPDVVFSAAHFSDSVNLNSLKLAKGDKVKATEIMKDAMRLEPQTAQGEVLRQQAILDAQKATWTNSSWASKLSEGIRKIFNDVSGDARIGDYLFPFVKTPANVIATGMDYAGMGIPKALVETVQAFRTGNLGSKEYFNNIARDLIRSGLGITAAVILANQLSEDDFVGAYDPSRAQIEALRNSNTSAFRVNGKWVSTDWLGPLSVPFSAVMYGRKYGETGAETTFQYGKGVLEQAKNLPGIQDAYDFIRTQANKDNQSLEEMTGETKNYIIDQLSSRLLPSFISDIAKATDPYNRVITKGWEALKSKIPGLRQTLPIKTNIFGEESKTEPWWSTILFGSRIKTDLDNDVTKELSNVSESTGKTISFTNWAQTTSKKLAQFKDAVGPEMFKDVSIEYGKILKSKLAELLINSAYQSLTDDDKLKGINSLDTKVIDKLFKQYGFKYDTKKAPDKSFLSTETGTALVKKGMSQEKINDLYREAIKADPVSAIKMYVTREKLKDVRGDAIIFERMGFPVSEGIKRQRGAKEGDKLDHTVPLELGGDNSLGNVKVVTNEEWKSYTSTENYLGGLLNKGKIKELDAQKAIKAFKKGEITANEIKSTYN